MKHAEESSKSSGVASQQLQPVYLTSSVDETVSTMQSTSNHAAVDPKYVQLLGDKAAVSLIALISCSSYFLFADKLVHVMYILDWSSAAKD